MCQLKSPSGKLGGQMIFPSSVVPVLDIELNQGFNGNKIKHINVGLPFLVRKRSISESLLNIVKHVSFTKRGKKGRKRK